MTKFPLNQQFLKYVLGSNSYFFCSGDTLILSASLMHRTKYSTAEGRDHSVAEVGLAGNHREGDEDDEALAEAVLDH